MGMRRGVGIEGITKKERWGNLGEKNGKILGHDSSYFFLDGSNLLFLFDGSNLLFLSGQLKPLIFFWMAQKTRLEA